VSGAIWDDAVRWASLVDGTQCPICLRGRPLGVLAERPHAWLTSGERVPVYGYVCVVARRHATEPYDLPAAERHGFWDDVCFAAERVARLLDPVKINYELHGNSLPHLHVHLFPRFRGDRFVGGPIDPRVEPVVLAADDLERLAAALAA
jgi:diadenosine tetraphosphate (Ap4A) HIT family hydrolase